MFPATVRPGLYPKGDPRPTDSLAEAKVFKALRQHLPAGWFAWHSLRIRTSEGIFGEGDFVIADPETGLLVLEVKGGAMVVHDGHWLQNGKPMEKAPLDQAKIFLEKLLGRLKEQDCRPPATGVGVCFPDTGFDKEPSQDDMRGMVIGMQELPWLDQALRRLMQQGLAKTYGPKGRWIDALHRMWCETWTPRLRLSQRAKLDEDERVGFDAQQLALLDCLAGNESLLVEGGAGSGKTLLAREAAVRLAARGKKVLYLCYTDALAHWLRAMNPEPGVTIATVRRHAVDMIREAGLEVGDEDSREFWDGVSLRAGAEALPRLNAKWDAVIVDEGQDFADEDWLLARELASRGRFWAFRDTAQSFWPERRMPEGLFAATFRLPGSHRCPPEILALARMFVAPSPPPADVEMAKAGVANGRIGIVACPSASAERDRVVVEIEKLRSEGLALADIAVVSLRGQTPPESIVHAGRLGSHPVVRADAESIESSAARLDPWRDAALHPSVRHDDAQSDRPAIAASHGKL